MKPTYLTLAIAFVLAAVSATLAAADIPANVIAGFFHDHVLVPIERVDDAVTLLQRLSEAS